MKAAISGETLGSVMEKSEKHFCINVCMQTEMWNKQKRYWRNIK